VRVTERALGSGVVTHEGDERARAMIRDELDRAFSTQPAFATVVGDVRMIGLAGTVATLAQLNTGLAVYDRDAVHHQEITREAVRHWRDLLANETPEVRLEHPGMVRGREDVLGAGLYVLDAVMERFGVDRLLSSENDILDGITRSLLGT
jgi:exopolyphosphatase/guanosine-5'-triphosphate,3'-diphosphate pyrophosphatase